MRETIVTSNAVTRTFHKHLKHVPSLTRLSRSTALIVLLLCIAYYTAAQIGLSLHFPASLVYFVWPPSVVLFVALVLSPRRVWGIYLLALFPIHMLAEWRTVAAPLVSLILFYGTVWVQAVAGSLCVERFSLRPFQLDSLRALIAVLLAGAGAAALTEALTLASILELTTNGSTFWLSFAQTYRADALTMLVLAPALFIGWATALRIGYASAKVRSGRTELSSTGIGVFTWLRTLSVVRVAEASLLTLGILGIGLVAFGGFISLPSTLLALLYAVLPLLLWTAVRSSASAEQASPYAA